MPPFQVPVIGRIDVRDVQEAVAADAEIDERRLDARLDVDDAALVDVADVALVAGALDVEFFEHAVFDDGDAAFLRLEDVDEHFLLHARTLIRIGPAHLRPASKPGPCGQAIVYWWCDPRVARDGVAASTADVTVANEKSLAMRHPHGALAGDGSDGMADRAPGSEAVPGPSFNFHAAAVERPVAERCARRDPIRVAGRRTASEPSSGRGTTARQPSHQSGNPARTRIAAGSTLGISSWNDLGDEPPRLLSKKAGHVACCLMPDRFLSHLSRVGERNRADQFLNFRDVVRRSTEPPQTHPYE